MSSWTLSPTVAAARRREPEQLIRAGNNRGGRGPPPPRRVTRTPMAGEGVGWPGASQPPAPTDPGVTVSRHRALLTGLSVRTDPLPVGEQSGRSLEEPGPPPLEPPVGPQPPVLLPSPAPQVGTDAPQAGL